MNFQKGTPKSLTEALLNGLVELGSIQHLTPQQQATLLEKHVKDWLSQRFSCYTINPAHALTAELLWLNLFKTSPTDR